jgi:hypothetical protein
MCMIQAMCLRAFAHMHKKNAHAYVAMSIGTRDRVNSVGSFGELGTLPPNPPEFTAFRPEWLFWFDYNRGT